MRGEDMGKGSAASGSGGGENGQEPRRPNHSPEQRDEPDYPSNREHNQSAHIMESRHYRAAPSAAAPGPNCTQTGAPSVIERPVGESLPDCSSIASTTTLFES